MKYVCMLWVVGVLAACVSGPGEINDPRTYASYEDTCPFDVDALYVIRTAGSPAGHLDAVTLWDWRNADCSREQITSRCAGQRLDVFCRDTVQSWTYNADGSTTFDEVDSSGLESSERVTVCVAGMET